MSWLNWSLKFHVRLRTISLLIPAHITHAYIQWMAYSFVWLYLIKCVLHTQSHVNQTQFFFFFYYFSFFWKVFCFKKFQLCLLATHFCESWSYEALVASLHRRFRDSLASETSSREKYLKKFQKFWVFVIFVTTSRVEAQSRSYSKRFATHWQMEVPVVKKT